MVSKLKTASRSHIESIIEIQLPVFCERCSQPTTKVSKCERMINTYYMKGITIVTLFGKSRLNENSVEAFFRCNAFSTH